MSALTPREIFRTLRVQAVTSAPRRPEVMGMDYQRLTHEEVQEVCRRSNEYGRLVAEVQALRKLAFTYQHGPASNLLTMPRFEDSAALLRKLGEDA